MSITGDLIRGHTDAIILSRLEEEQLNGKITGRAAALAYIKEHFKNEV